MFPKPLFIFSLFCFSCFLVGEESLESEKLILKPHPRLWVASEDLKALSGNLHSPILSNMVARVIEDAEWCVGANLIQENEAATYQMGTRAIASRLKNLTMAWAITGEERFRDAAMNNLKNMMNWKQISCEAKPGMAHEPLMYFCLSSGEHAADIALMYDLFRKDITFEEKKIFEDVLNRFYMRASLQAKDSPPWWVNKEWSNWNGVCAGSIGLLALAFYDDFPEARELLPFVEQSLFHYFRSYVSNGGGNHEGTGYWNYGMHYAIRYLLSWEKATGQKHSAFQIPEIGKSLNFPVDFTGISFGDNDGWHPAGFFFMMADRTAQHDAAARAAVHIYKHRALRKEKAKTKLSRLFAPDYLYATRYIPTQKEMKDLKTSREKKKVSLARVYDGLGWGVLADDTVFPHMRLAVRGGSNKISGHGHIDVMSFKCATNGVTMIEDQKGKGYSPVTFTGRGHQVYSRSAAAKSALFVHGLSPLEEGSARSTTILTGDGWKGIRVDGTGMYLPRWGRRFIGRLFLMVDQSYFMIIDSSLAAGGRNKGLESRFHTYGDLHIHDGWAVIQKEGETLTSTFASLGKGKLLQSQGTPEHPGKATHILRWMGGSDLQVTVLNPGEEKLGVELNRIKGGATVKVSGTGRKARVLKLSPRLEVIE